MSSTQTCTRTRPVPATTCTVGDGDDLLHVDVHGDLDRATPERAVLVMFGSPMDAGGFGSLAARFTDRPVVTFDPRGAGRNPTGTAPVTPEQHAEDLHRVISALDVGPVDLMASSGGAVNALALAQAHPEDVRRLVAHEPPTAVGLPDEEVLLRACQDVSDTYRDAGQGAAMAKFIALVVHDGPLPAAWADRPAVFVQPTEDDGDRTAALFRNGPACNAFAVDPDRLRPLGDRLVIGVGAASGQTMAARAGRQVAATLGLPVTEFPGDHAGFLGGEYGQQGDPDAFATRLREVLDR